mmetsp:Transcript_22625/g.90683  ORF Transcript_22625/g.90683 Transcript_22625/m.90683 type:complete len:193 (-) Transcript_22625:1950-2528(-)
MTSSSICLSPRLVVCVCTEELGASIQNINWKGDGKNTQGLVILLLLFGFALVCNRCRYFCGSRRCICRCRCLLGLLGLLLLLRLLFKHLAELVRSGLINWILPSVLAIGSSRPRIVSVSLPVVASTRAYDFERMHQTYFWYKNTAKTISSLKQASLWSVGILVMKENKSSMTVFNALYMKAFIGKCATLLSL